MQNIGWKIALIVVIVGLCLFALYPPDQKIRLGTDLRGGTSLIYTVNIPDDVGDKSQILAQTISVLKERVNPQGVLDISMQPLGLDRIEIVMPLPNEKVLALRKDYEAALASLLGMAEIQPDALDEALKFNQAVEKFGGNASAEGRAKDIASLQEAYNKIQTATEVLVDATRNAAAADVINKAQQAVADAQLDYDTLHESLLKQSLDKQRLVRALALNIKRQPVLDAKGNPQADPQTGDPMTTPSQREIAMDSLKRDFPHLVKQLDELAATYDAYAAKRTGFDDPEDLIRLLRGAGVLEFHIAVRDGAPEGVNIADMRKQLADVGPESTDSPMARWYPINELKQWARTPEQQSALQSDPVAFFSNMGLPLVGAAHEGQYYLLLYTAPNKCMVHNVDQRWSVESTFESPDQLGRPAVSFRLDAPGGGLMSRMTGSHVGEPMAIVLDNQVYSAPRLNSQIGNSGIIEGDFSASEISYLIRVLAAGALEARLSDQPIAINTLGPSLGADNLQRGMKAFLLSVIVTVMIMLVYYFLAGVFANIALLINAVIIFGTMAMIDGTFTLPGLAGIALSIAMAVDANVLIYERIREEMVNHGEDLRTAIRLGYQRAMSAIIDGNVAHLITCIVLMYTATTEVKGFALTMILGVISTLFTALFVTRVLFTIYTEGFKARWLPMLPTVFPAIHKALEPHINWIGKRYVFFTISIIASVLSLALVFAQGSSMLDTEFRGGVSLTMRTRAALPGEDKDADGRLLLSRPQVEAQVHELGETAGPDQPILRQLASASVLTVGESKDFKASRFQIKVGNPKNVESEETIADTVVEAIIKKFGDTLDVRQSLTFAGAGSASHTQHTYPITVPDLGESIQKPQYPVSVREFMGGVAVVVEGISPPAKVDEVRERLNRMREQPDFRDLGGRKVQVIGLEPADPGNVNKGYTSVAVVVADPALNYAKVDFGLWDSKLAGREWSLVSQALIRPASLEQVSEFSSAVAETLRANALVAVILSLLGMLVYIWIRFGSLRYSVATVVAVSHNVVICLGAIALTHWLAPTKFASWMMLGEFRIDLNVIAALLTIIGYSLNDTIVILDRIRENRGKRILVTPEIVNNSINQTFSRTILTGGSTILASVILYVLGGTGLQPFAFTFFIGLVVGTYSSVTIAAPLVIGGPKAQAPEPIQEPTRRLPERVAVSS